MSDCLPVLSVYVGDFFRVPLQFREHLPSVAPINLTGATIYVTAKTSAAQDDEDAAVREKVTSHDDATAGLSSFELDLRAVTITARERWIADIVLEDSAGKLINYGRWEIEVNPPVTTELLA